MVDIRFGNRRLCWPSYSIEMSESSRASRGGLRRRADRRRVELAVVSRQSAKRLEPDARLPNSIGAEVPMD